MAVSEMTVFAHSTNEGALEHGIKNPPNSGKFTKVVPTEILHVFVYSPSHPGRADVI